MLSFFLLAIVVALNTTHPGNVRRQRKENEFNKVRILICLNINFSLKGWAAFLADEYSEFHDLPLTWALNTTVPAWLKGSLVSMSILTND